MGNSSSRDQAQQQHNQGSVTVDDPRLHQQDSSQSRSRRQFREREDFQATPASAPPGESFFSGSGLRQGRQDTGFFAAGPSHGGEPREARRETRGEKETRRAERDRRMRLKERTRSMQTEDVDGGYLVTMGVYTVAEDFSKPIVRQMMIERRLAPFWKGLEEIDRSWTDSELIKAVRGETASLDPSRPPTFQPIPLSPNSPSLISPQGPPGDPSFLDVPNTAFRSRSRSCESGQTPSSRGSPQNPPHLDPTSSSSSGRGLPVRPRSKTQAVVTSASDSQDAANLLALETKLPPAGMLAGRCLERVLYEHPTDCSICFLSYPKWLNKTRCCDQPICSECFVQIKRPDPHVPEHHEGESTSRPPSPHLASDLVSEPACCPYCKIPEFGISYEAPPFRRGLAYANSEISRMAASRAEELTAAIISETAEISASPPDQVESRRRITSLSVDDPAVITTDRIRPDWAQKLSNARAQLQRRAAAATALHTAAYVMGNDGRSPFGFGFGRRTLLRRGPEDGGIFTGEGMDATSRGAFDDYVRARMGDPSHRAHRTLGEGRLPSFASPSGGHQPRIVDIEEMMMMEAIRQSLLEDEERKKREETEARQKGRSGQAGGMGPGGTGGLGGEASA